MNDGDLAEFIRAHRVHFDVRPEIVVSPRGRKTVGFEIRLSAVHPKGVGALPGCPKCDELVARLHCIADAVIPRERRPTMSTIEPFDRALYDSHETPGADEVALTIRLSHREHYDAPVDGCEERCLKEIRSRLKALRVQER